MTTYFTNPLFRRDGDPWEAAEEMNTGVTLVLETTDNGHDAMRVYLDGKPLETVTLNGYRLKRID